jgi:hypothetical protein
MIATSTTSALRHLVTDDRPDEDDEERHGEEEHDHDGGNESTSVPCIRRYGKADERSIRRIT